MMNADWQHCDHDEVEYLGINREYTRVYRCAGCGHRLLHHELPQAERERQRERQPRDPDHYSYRRDGMIKPKDNKTEHSHVPAHEASTETGDDKTEPNSHPTRQARPHRTAHERTG